MAKVNRRIKPVKAKTSSRKQAFVLVAKKCVRYCQWLLTVASVIALIGVAGFYSVKAANHFLNRPITEVVINGNFEYVDRSKISDTANQVLGGSFISESILKVQKSIELMSWVDEVSIARAWPNKVIITIYEQAPIARWSDKGFVNVRGELVFTDELQQLIEFPVLQGKDSQVVDVIEKYSVLTQMLHPYALAISELEKDSRGAWRVKLRNNWNIVLGRGEILQKMDRLTTLMDQQLVNPGEDIAVIDIRYPNGVSVKWNPEKQQEEQALSLDIHSMTTINEMKSKTESSHVNDMVNTRG